VDRAGLLVEHGGRTVRVRPLPISIPFRNFEQLALSAPEPQWENVQVILLWRELCALNVLVTSSVAADPDPGLQK
jgi:hypothetical protein